MQSGSSYNSITHSGYNLGLRLGALPGEQFENPRRRLTRFHLEPTPAASIQDEPSVASGQKKRERLPPIPTIQRQCGSYEPVQRERQHESLPPALHQGQNGPYYKFQGQTHFKATSAASWRESHIIPVRGTHHVSPAQNWLHHKDEVKPIDDNFVQDIVGIFKDQRTQRHQFAVLIVSPQYQVTMKPPPFCTMTDNSIGSSPTYPPNSTLKDWIVARPDRPKHAEELLLERFDELLAQNEYSCRSIVLYTWFVPCDDCTGKIIDVLGHFKETHAHVTVTVVYSKKMKAMSEEHERRNTSMLEAAGITVIKRRYQGYLQPAVKIKPRATALTYTLPHIPDYFSEPDFNPISL